jgi:uroporphyrin-III C-methyltransferase
LRALQSADVVLYDALVSKELLVNTKPSCKQIYVGKRKGKKEFAQEEINQLLVFYAQRYTTVVRLKGGDPNVFGRGHEEQVYVTQYGIDSDVIPGVSSAIAAPASAGIPLTKRGVNESFWVITGTLSTGEMANDIHLAASSTATLVILMGVSHLDRIAELIARMRSAEEPIAIVQSATLPEQKVITGTAATITAQAEAAAVSSPAVIIIGQVVLHQHRMASLIKETVSITL